MEFPTWMCSKDDPKPRLVKSQADLDALPGTWYDSPAFDEASHGGPASAAERAALPAPKPLAEYPMLLWNAKGKSVEVANAREAAEKIAAGYAESPAGPFADVEDKTAGESGDAGDGSEPAAVPKKKTRKKTSE